MSRYSKWNNAIKELKNRRIDYEAEIAELKDLIGFVTDYTLTLENTIEHLDVREYIADLGAELENRHEEYESEINNLSNIVYFESRKSPTDYIFQQIDTGTSPNSVRPDFGIRPEPPKPEISIDRIKVEQLDKDSEEIRARLMADEYYYSEELETENQPRYEPIHVNGKTDAGVMGNPVINGADSVKHATVAGFLHRSEDTPDDPLMEPAGIARVIGDGESKAAKLIGVMMENDWECPATSIEVRFPGEFINVIFDEINSIALEEIGDNLILEEDGLWVVLEDNRDEIEYTLQL